MTERQPNRLQRASRDALTFAALATAIGWTVLPVRSNAQIRDRAESPAVAEEPTAIGIDDARVVEGATGVSNLVFRIRLSAPSANALTVRVRTVDSTATQADQDYEAFDFPITFAPGSTAEWLAVAVRGDVRVEPNECFRVCVTPPQGITVAHGEAMGLIVNDDLPLLSVDDASTPEGEVGIRRLDFTLRLSAPAPDTVGVDVATFDSTATTADADYQLLRQHVVIEPGATFANVSVKLLGDAKVERDEWFRLRLRALSGAVFADSEAVGTILNDDLPVLTVSDTLIAEGESAAHAMTFRVRLSAPNLGTVSFHYQTADGTALASDSDYLPVQGDTVLLAGQDQFSVDVPIIGDARLEGNDRFTLQVSNLQGATSTKPFGIGTISNDERATFTRVLVNVPQYFPGTLPPSWGDANGDGLPDLPLSQNAGDRFVEMPGVRTILGNGNYHGSAWCDYDRDGDLDFVQLPYGGPERASNRVHLFENTGAGFLDKGAAAGMDIVGFGETPAWADFDADGWPDLFMPFYAHEAPYHSFLYMNDGAGQFHEFADSAGVALRDLPAGRRPEGVAATDWNGDGTIDLYCAGHLFLNDGDARFTDVRAQVGLPQMFEEGAQFVDFDDDGDFDLYLRTVSGPTLFRNDEGRFNDASATLGIGPLAWEWGDRWADLDSDGDLDLLFFPPGALARLRLSNGDGTFREDSSFVGLFSGSSLSSFADIDGDGDIDIAVGADGRMVAHNLANTLPTTRTRFLKVRVVDENSRLTQYGASVRLRSLDDPRRPIQTRFVDGGSGYLGQDEYTITFGGLGSGAYDLEVSFPSKIGNHRVVGPAQNALLAGIRPGDGAPLTIVVRPSGAVTLQAPPTQPVAESETPPVTESELTPAPLNPAGMQWTAKPNPARESLRFAMTATAGTSSAFTLLIHDVNGRLLRSLEHGDRSTRTSDITWDLRDEAGQRVPAGMYFVRVTSGASASSPQRVIVLP